MPKAEGSLPTFAPGYFVLSIHPIYHDLSSRPCNNTKVRNSKGKCLTPNHPAGRTARSWSNSPAITFKESGKQNVWNLESKLLSTCPGVGHCPGYSSQERSEEKEHGFLPLPSSAAGRGIHALSRLLEPQQLRESVAVFCLPEAKEEGLLSF